MQDISDTLERDVLYDHTGFVFFFLNATFCNTTIIRRLDLNSDYEVYTIKNN